MAVIVAYDGHPAWVAKVPDPTRFRDVEYQLQWRLFAMPQGALAAAWLRLYDIPDQPYFLHRILDLSDRAIQTHLEQLRDGSELLLVMQSPGEQGMMRRSLRVDSVEVGRVLSEGLSHNRSLAKVEGPAALKAFGEAFNPVSGKSGVAEGWAAVERLLPQPGLPTVLRELASAPAPAPRPPASSKVIAAAVSVAATLGVALALLSRC